jgi:hypothetical protein
LGRSRPSRRRGTTGQLLLRSVANHGARLLADPPAGAAGQTTPVGVAARAAVTDTAVTEVSQRSLTHTRAVGPELFADTWRFTLDRTGRVQLTVLRGPRARPASASVPGAVVLFRCSRANPEPDSLAAATIFLVRQAIVFVGDCATRVHVSGAAVLSAAATEQTRRVS